MPPGIIEDLSVAALKRLKTRIVCSVSRYSKKKRSQQSIQMLVFAHRDRSKVSLISQYLFCFKLSLFLGSEKWLPKNGSQKCSSTVRRRSSPFPLVLVVRHVLCSWPTEGCCRSPPLAAEGTLGSRDRSHAATRNMTRTKRSGRAKLTFFGEGGNDMVMAQCLCKGICCLCPFRGLNANNANIIS